MAQKSFDWDDISVGYDDLDHSQNFFAKKHLEHERREKLDTINERMAGTSIDNKENIAANAFCLPTIKVEVVSPTHDENELNIAAPGAIPKDELPPTDSDEHSVIVDAETADRLPASTHVVTEQGGHLAAADPNVTVKPCKPPSNVCPQWSTQKTVVPKNLKSARSTEKLMPAPPKAYKFADVYQRRKEEAMQRRLEEEKKLREFHSRPAPNLRRTEENRTKLHRVTVPVTPKVLKTSRETDVKRKQKCEELKRQQRPARFEARIPTILKEEPFLPKKTPTVIQQQPFNLHTENRLKERKQYNAAVNGAMAEKKKQEEEERKKREEEHIKQLRKQMTFKARPNPFK